MLTETGCTEAEEISSTKMKQKGCILNNGSGLCELGTLKFEEYYT